MTVQKKVLIGVAVFLALVVVAVGVLVYTFDANQYRDVVLQQFSRTVNRPVEAADLELQLFPLRLRLNQVRIPEDPSFPGEEFIRAEAVQFEFSLWALLRGKAQVQALELVQPTVNLRQNPEGEWNATTLAAAPEEEEPPSAEAPAASPVRNWRIEEGTILIERPDQPTLRLTGVELAATDISTTEPFPVRLAVSFAEQSRISTDGRLGPLDLSAPARTPFQGELQLEKFRPDALSSLIAVPPELARLGAMSGTLKLHSGPEEIAAQGKITLLGSEEEDDLSLQLDVKLPPDFRRVEAGETIVEYGDARVRGQGSVELTPPYAFNLDLTTSEAELGALRQVPLRLGYPLPSSPPAATGRVTSDLKLEGTPEEWVASGKAKITALAVKPEGFPETLRTDSLELTLDPERITAAPFNLSLAPGVVLTVSGAVEDYRTRPRLEARVTAGEQPIGPLLALAASFGVDVLGEGRQASGFVRPELELAGPLAEPSSLTYRGTLAFRDVSLSAAQLPEPVRLPSLRLALDPKRVSAEPFTAELGEKLRARVEFRLQNYQTLPSLTAQGETDGADLTALLNLARALGHDPLPGGEASGQVAASVNVRGTLGKQAPPLAISGRAQLTGASVRPATLTQPLGIGQAELEFSSDRLEVKRLLLVAAGSRVEGSLRVDNFDAPRVRFDLQGDKLDVDGLQSLFASRPASSASGFGSPVPAVYAQERTSDWFSRLNGGGRLNFEQVTHGTLTLAPFVAPVAIANQVITCDPIQFGLYGGGGRGRAVVDLRRAEPVVEFNGLLRNVDANELLSQNTDLENRLHGRLGGTLEVRFAGQERPQILRSARGQGQLSLVEGRLSEVNLSRELGTVAQLSGLRFQKGETPIEDLTANFEIADGWLRTEELTLNTPDLTLVASGGLSLDDQMDLEGTAVFSPEASQRLAGRGVIGALAGNFLTDEQGRVVIPFVVGGSFRELQFRPDLGRLGKMKLRKQGDQPGGPLRDLLDRVIKRKPPRR